MFSPGGLLIVAVVLVTIALAVSLVVMGLEGRND